MSLRDIKIYDKTLEEILKDIPMSFKIMMVAGLSFVAFTIIYVPYVYFTFGDKNDVIPPLVIQGLDRNVIGTLDPSVAYDGDHLFMAYTAASLQSAQVSDIKTEIFIARDRRLSRCTSWSQSNIPFPAKAVTIIGPDGQTPVDKGFWRIETPSLVYDPDDPGKEWKLYAYKYFWSGKTDLARLYGAIVYRYASNPDIEASWSTEQWVFSASEQSPPFPYSQIVQTKLSQLHPSLANVYFYSRPSVVYIDKTLVMSLSAFVKGKQTPDRIVMIASKDHGQTWHYMGTPLQDTMLPAIKTETGKYTLLQGATLLLSDGMPYLSAVFGNSKTEGDGSFIFGFDNISAASLAKDQNGNPLLLNHIPLSSEVPTNVGGGFAAFNEGCTQSGVIAAEMSGVRRRYSIFRTEASLLPKAE